MNILLTTITILTLSVCGPSKDIVTQNLKVIKNIEAQKEKTIIYKKVPTKWVKIAKKSN